MRRKTTEEALTSNRDEADPEACWLWLGSVTTQGYGQVEVVEDERRKNWLAHRLAHYLATGDLPPQVHHLCGEKLCVNPAHLTGMTLTEHQHAHHLRQECIHGHSYDDPANVYVRPDGKGRQCRACNRTRRRG